MTNGLVQLTRRLLRSPVAWTGAFTVLRGLGFLLVMAYALRVLPPTQIGLWYVMLSIAGVAAFVEFGFAATIGRYTSYFAGGATDVPQLGLAPPATNPAPNTRGLAGVIRMAQRLYLVFGLAVVGVMIAAWLVWIGVGRDTPACLSMPTMVLACLALGTGINMTGFFWTGILFGLNRVALHNQFMIVGLLVGYAATLAGLLAGGGLLALVLGQIVIGLLPRLLARAAVLRLVPAAAFNDPMMLSWRHLWPMTWRAGVASLASYVYVQGLTFMCSLFSDLAITGSFGLSLQMALMLHAFAAAWVWVKHPQISAHRVRGETHAVMRLLAIRMPLSVATYAAGAACLAWVGPVVLTWLGSKTPLLPSGQLCALFVLVGLDLMIGHHAAILQTGNEVPHLKAFVLTAVLTAGCAWPLGRTFQVWGIIAAPFVAQVALNYW